MRIKLFLIIGISLVILAGCKQFLADIENDLKYWASSVDTWEKLQNAVKNAGDGDTVMIRGELKAINKAGCFGEIVIDKNLTIVGVTGRNTDILNANRDELGTNAHRIFNVERGKTLFLKGLTLKNGKTEDTRGGGAVYSEGNLFMEDCIIENCAVVHGGGGIYIDDDGSLTIESCIIQNNTAGGNGGGIFSFKGELTIKGASAIKRNTAAHGGGIYLHDAECTLESGIIGGLGAEDKNTASDDGGGVYIRGDGKLNMKGGSITGNEARVNGGGVYSVGGWISMTGNAVITPSSGSDLNKPGKNDVYLLSNQKIKIEGILTQNVAARITPNNYLLGEAVLTGALSSGSPENYKRFRVTPQGSKQWSVDSNGKLASP
ncbi:MULTISPECIES: right-handed parallel beta-helix repeat-containing protein [unclassified Treponema]|uniref:right-handed parallel beta-helix repeat-containing protein n=1 Tax=unclassified Treponema TaxID=2638727 RepID=UPI0020A48387|nr:MULTISPECIES: right-handed parallel beta-helix repeat-containing protein [unclassified Treponema]UTC68395.1 right-handed parallel beta-helix repeat-containing protein [Treponema sp. OMZ 789]UTC71115.1 right-handed parallel beta-helix repeat-containing protein [Treponema sp. OMZ 790]UTC71269.1 right-handed parallel beta-helix repeat-containing protein [Treponema sp. OMZ 791]